MIFHINTILYIVDIIEGGMLPGILEERLILLLEILILPNIPLLQPMHLINIWVEIAYISSNIIPEDKAVISAVITIIKIGVPILL